MIPLEYYRFENIFRSRYDAISRCGEHLQFERQALNVVGPNKGGLSVHIRKTPPHFKAARSRLPDLIITKADNITGVFLPDIKNPLIGYGDIQGTRDAVIVLFSEDHRSFELLIARDHLNDILQLFYAVREGKLDFQISELRSNAECILHRQFNSLPAMVKSGLIL